MTSEPISEQIKAFQPAGGNATGLGFQAETQPARGRAMRRFAAEIMAQFPG